jgi:hypothetical protein
MRAKLNRENAGNAQETRKPVKNSESKNVSSQTPTSLDKTTKELKSLRNELDEQLAALDKLLQQVSASVASMPRRAAESALPVPNAAADR